MTDSAPTDIARIENLPLRMQVADTLRRAIINGKMKPGTPIVELNLANQLNISRAPVREAIQILENEGLIETVAYKGKRVKPLTPREVEELYSLREQFEAFAVRRIIEFNKDVSPLEPFCQAMTEAAAHDDFEALMVADQGFHRTLISLSDHAILLSVWDNLFLRIHQIMALRNKANRDLNDVARNHLPIVAALRKKDIILAISLISDHTRSAADITNNAELFAKDE
ncbi:GntR family transcriptional regulator [Pelagibacterium lentulum]|uniref:GntR family transcriptional regulator n=1 Tax=Pelagibacterium lentulum TaxID=2029865 RepID=A0A916RG11_9HYPH|nr:GntR family transcriptional regulator [Pelagibacterium lentulum]GGA55224.1 GntR family transcriptional regulator [Pelagibacterium lentulum]